MDPSSADAHSTYAFISLFRRRYDKALRHSQEAVRLNANDGVVQITRGLVLTYTGEAETASVIIKAALDLEPFPPAWFESILALSLFTCGKYEDAAGQLVRLLEGERWFNTIGAACYAMAGRTKEAERHASAILAFDPGFSASSYVSVFHPYQAPTNEDRFAQALIKAGLRA